jgi:hypothetical protein
LYTENPRSVERPFSLSIDKCRFPELALPFLIAEQGFLSFDRNKDSRNHESKY